VIGRGHLAGHAVVAAVGPVVGVVAAGSVVVGGRRGKNGVLGAFVGIFGVAWGDHHQVEVGQAALEVR